MDFTFTEEQEILRNSLRTYLKKRYSFEDRAKSVSSAAGLDMKFWRSLADDLGILSLAFPERAGGLEADATSTLVVMEELGRALVVEPYLETVVICGGLLRRIGGAVADKTLEKIGSGEQLLSFAWSEPQTRYNFASVETRARRNGSNWLLQGVKTVVNGAPGASHLLVTARTSGVNCDREGLSLFLVDVNSPGITLTAYATVDGRRAADVVFDQVELSDDSLLGSEGQVLPLIERVGDEAIAAMGAEALGVTSRLLEDTVSYTKQRRQFGQTLASFQVLQHRIADMYMQIEMARSATYYATMQLEELPRQRALAASTAKVTVSRCCRFVGQNAVQLHGGMGITDELMVGHFFKRSTVIEGELGTSDFHLARYAELSTKAAKY